MTTPTTMTLTQALARAKSLRNELEVYWSQGTRPLIGAIDVTGRLVGQGIEKEQAQRQFQASNDGYQSKYSAYVALRTAIAQANLNTTFEFQGRVISILEAVEIKAALGHRQAYLQTMQTQVQQVRSTVEKRSREIEQQKSSYLKEQSNSEHGATDPRVASTLAIFDQSNYSTFDPLNITDRARELSEELSQIRTELDYRLSEVNATTQINVQL